MKAPGVVLASVCLLSSCALFQPDTQRAEVLFNPVVTAGQLEVSVMTSGCTQPEDFYLSVTGEHRIELRRTRIEACRGPREFMRLSFEYPFGQQVYQFRNEVRFSNRFQP